jgi:hypothetical protein
MSTLTHGNERLHAVNDTNFTLDRRFADLKEVTTCPLIVTTCPLIVI